MTETIPGDNVLLGGSICEMTEKELALLYVGEQWALVNLHFAGTPGGS